MKRYSAEVGAPAKRSLHLHSSSKKPVAEILSGLCAQTFIRQLGGDVFNTEAQRHRENRIFYFVCSVMILNL